MNPGTQYRFLHSLLDGDAGLAVLGISNMSPELLPAARGIPRRSEAPT